MPPAADDVIAQRVRLRDHARPIRRSPTEVQFGLSPTRGIVLSGLSEAETGWLMSLAGVSHRRADRSRTTSTRPGVLVGSAASWGLTGSRALELLAVLRAHDLLNDGIGLPGVCAVEQPVSTPSSSPLVCVLGAGSVPESIRSLTGACGIVNVTETFDLRTPPTLTVIVVRDAVGERDRSSWARSGLDHMPVIIGPEHAVLGPLVRANGPGPCLACLDLSRKDRDTVWPFIAAQISAVPSDWDCDISVDPPLGPTIASLTSMLIRAHLNDIPVPDGVTWEVALPWPHVTTRLWHRHPACVEHKDAGN